MPYRIDNGGTRLDNSLQLRPDAGVTPSPLASRIEGPDGPVDSGGFAGQIIQNAYDDR
jgi:hypothetical protein